MITKVQVTQQDIEDSAGDTIESGMFCPIDRAAGRLVKDGIDVCTTRERIKFYPHDFCLNGAELPEEAKQFVYAFDNDLPGAQPFEFEIEIPDEVLK
jgi:hypothetical protein